MILTIDDVIPKEHHLLFCSSQHLVDEVATHHGLRTRKHRCKSAACRRRCNRGIATPKVSSSLKLV